MKYNFIF